MEFSKIKFSSVDIVKGATFLAVVGGMWMDLKTDQIKGVEERKFLQYQVDELKSLCQSEAVLPKEPKIENEQNN